MSARTACCELLTMPHLCKKQQRSNKAASRGASAISHLTRTLGHLTPDAISYDAYAWGFPAICLSLAMLLRNRQSWAATTGNRSIQLSRTTDRLSCDLATTGSRIIQLAGNINRLSSKAAFGHSAGGQYA